MELLVVIGIIALLAALLTPVVMQSLTKARNAAIKAEIDMLHMAIMNYKNEYGSFPPCIDLNPAAPLISGSMTSSAQKHLARLFPRCTNISGPTGQFQGAVPLTPANAIFSWLSGYTTNPTSPLLPATDRKKLFDFDQSRFASTNATDATTLVASRLVYFPSGKPASPYLYINSAAYGTTNVDGTINTPAVYPVPTLYTVKGTTPSTHTPTPAIISAEPQALPGGTFFFNRDSFQILCAGRDEQFGTDDDLSNFWPGTRREYLDSLKD